MLFNLLTILSLLGTLFAAFQNNPFAVVLGVFSAFGWLIAGVLDDTISLLDNTPFIGDRHVQ